MPVELLIIAVVLILSLCISTWIPRFVTVGLIALIALFIQFDPGVHLFLVNNVLYQQTLNVDSQLSLDLENLFLEAKHSDLVIKTKDSIFHVHNCILRARSKVFAQMPDDQKAMATKTPTYALREILRYLYSSRMGPVEPDQLPDVYRAAREFEVEPLQKFCENRMEQNMSPKTAIEYLRLGEEQGNKRLRDLAATFIAQNYHDMKTKDEWKVLMTTRTDLTHIVIDLLASMRP